MFGSTLAELKSQDKTNIPLFVLCCIKNIEKHEENLRTDGLYRISGNAAQIQKIRFEVRKVLLGDFLRQIQWLLFDPSLASYLGCKFKTVESQRK